MTPVLTAKTVYVIILWFSGHAPLQEASVFSTKAECEMLRPLFVEAETLVDSKTGIPVSSPLAMCVKAAVWKTP